MIKRHYTWRRTSNVSVVTSAGNKEHGLWLARIEYLKTEEKRELNFVHFKPRVNYKVKCFRVEALRQHSTPNF